MGAPQLHVERISVAKLTPACGFLHSRVVLSPLIESLVFAVFFVQLRDYQGSLDPRSWLQQSSVDEDKKLA